MKIGTKVAPTTQNDCTGLLTEFRDGLELYDNLKEFYEKYPTHPTKNIWSEYKQRLDEIFPR